MPNTDNPVMNDPHPQKSKKPAWMLSLIFPIIMITALVVIVKFGPTSAIPLGISAILPPALQHDQPGTLQGEVFVATKGGTSYKLGSVRVAILPYETIRPCAEKINTQYLERLKTLGPQAKAAEEDYRQKQAATLSAIKASPDTSLMFDNQPEYDRQRAAYDANLKAAQDAESAAFKKYLSLDAELRKVISGENLYDNIVFPTPICTTITDADGKYTVQLPSRTSLYVVCAEASRSIMGDTEYYYWMVQASFEKQEKKTFNLDNHNMADSGNEDSLLVTK